MVELSDDWRPDRSGIIVRPDGLTTGEITVYVVHDTDFLWSDMVFETLAGWLENGLALALSIPGPIGTLPVRSVVTDYLRPALETRDRAMFDLLLRNALDGLARHAWQADGITARYDVSQPL